MPATHTSIVKLSELALKTPILRSIIVPAAKLFVSYSGYRQLGLKFDDIIHEENPVYQKALTRLPKSELYSRNFRTLTAAQCGITHHLLPVKEQVKPEDDTPYILPYLLEIEAELAEKEELDNYEPVKK